MRRLAGGRFDPQQARDKGKTINGSRGKNSFVFQDRSGPSCLAAANVGHGVGEGKGA